MIWVVAAGDAARGKRRTYDEAENVYGNSGTAGCRFVVGDGRLFDTAERYTHHGDGGEHLDYGERTDLERGNIDRQYLVDGRIEHNVERDHHDEPPHKHDGEYDGEQSRDDHQGEHH